MGQSIRKLASAQVLGRGGVWALLALGLLLVPGLIAPALAQAPPAPRSAPQRFVVVLDPAHGGDDGGAALKSGQPEKALTLAFALKIRSLLGARGMQVVFTRENDATLDGNQRAETANRAQAQACLSLHFTDTGSGAHLYASNLAQSPAAHFVPWKTAQSVWINRSLALTGQINSALQHTGVPVTLSRWSLPGVDSMACPAMVIEIAPERAPGSPTVLSAVDDVKYQSRIAEAIAAALVVWRTEAKQP